jgi:hypothetical protein
MAKRRRPIPDIDPGRDVSADERPAPPDPRWLLSPHAKRIAAHRFFLLTGEHPECRLPGWVTLAQGEHGEPTAEDVWLKYRDDLIAEALTAGFKPHRMTGRRPTGEAFKQWRARFIALHTY